MCHWYLRRPPKAVALQFVFSWFVSLSQKRGGKTSGAVVGSCKRLEKFAMKLAVMLDWNDHEKSSLEPNLNVVIRPHDKDWVNYINGIIPRFFSFSVRKKAKKSFFLFVFANYWLSTQTSASFKVYGFCIYAPILCRLNGANWVRKGKGRPQVKLLEVVRIWKSLQWKWLWRGLKCLVTEHI